MRGFRVFLLVASLTACKDPLPPVVIPPEPVVVVGTYALQSIKGQSLPWVMARRFDGTPAQEVTGGSLTLTADKTYSQSATYRYTAADGTISEAVSVGSGTYTTTDSGAVTLRAAGGVEHAGQVTGKTLTISFAGCCEPWVMVRP